MPTMYIVSGIRKKWHNGETVSMRARTATPYATVNFWNSLFNVVQIKNYGDDSIRIIDVSVYDIKIEEEA